MTTQKQMTKRAKRIKELVLQGYTVPSIAKRIRKSPNSIREILNVLVHKGELIRVPNTNPAVYRDPHAHPIKKLDENDPKVEKFDEPIQDYLPEGMEIPLGYVNVHIAGYVAATIREKGEFRTINIDGKPRVFWDEPKPAGKGLTMWSCHMLFFGQELKVNYYEGSKGSRSCRLYLNRIYVDPKKVSKTRRYEYFMERAEYLVKTLRLTGWQITDLQIKGKFHYGKENDPLSQFIPQGADTDNTDITTDTSPDKVETEMENIDDLPEAEGEELLQIYANIPSSIRELRETNRQQQILLGELQQTLSLQNQAIASLTQNLTSLTQATVQLTTMGIAGIQKDVSGKIRQTWEGYL